MVAFEHKFESLLTDEIQRLLEVLPPPLSGGAPVSALLFQPTKSGGRLVYLDRDVRRDNLISIDPGQVSVKFFFDVDDKSPWSAAEASVEQPTLVEYCEKNESDIRQRLAKQDGLRYSSIQFDRNGVVSAGTRYSMHYLVPPPVYHHNIGWWKRLPRLGQIYSLGDQLEHKNLLLICGMSVGIRALGIRLKLLLDCENAVRRTAFEIATAVASNRSVNPDDFQYLLAKLVAAHHWFYPYDPVALKIFRRLGSDPDTVLNLHGWPATGWNNFDTNTPLGDLISQLAQDLSFLIYACTIWTAPGENERKPSTELYDELKAALRTTIALICGTPRHARVSGRTDVKYQDYPAEYMCIEPAKEILQDKNTVPELPLLSRGQLVDKDHKWSKIADAYLLSLSPVGPAPIEKWNKIRTSSVRGERAWLQRKEMGKWLTGYTRARCLMKLMEEEQAVKHGAA